MEKKDGINIDIRIKNQWKSFALIINIRDWTDSTVYKILMLYAANWVSYIPSPILSSTRASNKA